MSNSLYEIRKDNKHVDKIGEKEYIRISEGEFVGIDFLFTMVKLDMKEDGSVFVDEDGNIHVDFDFVILDYPKERETVGVDDFHAVLQQILEDVSTSEMLSTTEQEEDVAPLLPISTNDNVVLEEINETAL